MLCVIKSALRYIHVSNLKKITTCISSCYSDKTQAISQTVLVKKLWIVQTLSYRQYLTYQEILSTLCHDYCYQTINTAMSCLHETKSRSFFRNKKFSLLIIYC